MSDKREFYVYTIADLCGVVRYVGKGGGYRDRLHHRRNSAVTGLIRAGLRP